MVFHSPCGKKVPVCETEQKPPMQAMDNFIIEQSYTMN